MPVPPEREERGVVEADRPSRGLHRWFRAESEYGGKRPYRLLPFRFSPLDSARYVATNLAGEFLVLTRPQIERLVAGTMTSADSAYDDLIGRQFMLEGESDVGIDLLATKTRTRFAPLTDMTALHLFVLTLRCDHSCPYCQVSRVSSDRAAFDMSVANADRAIDLVFASPHPAPKIEFQGGESLLNFDLLRHVVLEVERRNESAGRDFAFVVATNLSQVTDEMLHFLRDHRVFVSTSLDGPRDLHNANRPRPGGDSFERTIAGIRRCRDALGEDAVAALMTTTRESLAQPEAIVDEYVNQSFRSIFLRWMSPYGFAARSARSIGYSSGDWQSFYERGLRHVIRRCIKGTPIREEYAAIILRKMLTPYATGYVDLRSPTGLGIGAVVYNYDGDVYASDESRMLAESGDRSFRLGNLATDSYADLFLSPRLRDIVATTMTESTPMCADCAYEPFCGTDPTFHHATQGDMVGHRPTSEFCSRNMFVFRLLVRILEDEPSAARVLRSWV